MYIKLSKPLFSLAVTVTLFAAGSTALQAQSDPFVGEIKMVSFNYAPRGWAHCNGQILSINQYTILFALVGTTYGGDGRTTFALPDLRGRAAIHPGTGPGLSTIVWGARGGTETRTLTEANLPAHRHVATLRGVSRDGTDTSPVGRALANDPREEQYAPGAPDVDMTADSVIISNTGGGQSFGVRDPYLGIYHCIALQGIFPPRN